MIKNKSEDKDVKIIEYHMMFQKAYHDYIVAKDKFIKNIEAQNKKQTNMDELARKSKADFFENIEKAEDERRKRTGELRKLKRIQREKDD